MLLIFFVLIKNEKIFSQDDEGKTYNIHTIDLGLGISSKIKFSTHLRYHIHIYSGFQMGAYLNYEVPDFLSRRIPSFKTRDIGLLASKEFILDDRKSFRISSGISYISGTRRGKYLFYDDTGMKKHYYEKIDYTAIGVPIQINLNFIKTNFSILGIYNINPQHGFFAIGFLFSPTI